jgi:hypothetical protein
LVIFGSASTMAGDKLLKGFLDLMGEKGWILRLKAGAERVHHFAGDGEEEAKVADVKTEVKKEVKVEKGILIGRPFLREAIEVSDLITPHGQY